MKRFCGLISLVIGIIGIAIFLLNGSSEYKLFNLENGFMFVNLFLSIIGVIIASFAPLEERHTPKSCANIGASINAFLGAFSIGVLLMSLF